MDKNNLKLLKYKDVSVRAKLFPQRGQSQKDPISWPEGLEAEQEYDRRAVKGLVDKQEDLEISPGS